MFQTAKMLWLFLNACIHIHMSCHMWESQPATLLIQWCSLVLVGVVLITGRGYIFIGPSCCSNWYGVIYGPWWVYSGFPTIGLVFTRKHVLEGSGHVLH